MKVLGALSILLLLAACAAGPMAPISSAVTDWAAPTGDLPNTRHSALAQITPGNVGRLQLAWHSATGAPRGQEGGPLVIGDTLYLHSPFPNQVVALNLADQSVRWTCEPHQDATVVPLMCCDVVSRGLAYGHGKIFLQQADATLVALDARTGARLWQAHNGDARRGATATNAPQVFDRYVVTGISSGEYGVRGYSVGPDADLLIDPARDRAALERRAPGRCSTARSMRA